MYCMKCGAENDDQSKYCVKCGHQLNAVAKDGNKSEKDKRKSRNMFIIAISLVLVVTIVIISVFDLWPWSFRRDKKASDSQSDRNVNSVEMKSDTGTSTVSDISLDEIVERCPDCEAAIETYIELLKISRDWTSSTDDIEALESQKCAQMQHLCTAGTIYVEDMPYAYHGSFGFYTGDWVGAGPSGKGSYFGTVYGGRIISYDGDWGFGLPNGNGVLYEENYLRDWDRTYIGEMKNGVRDGEGTWFEYHEDQESLNPTPTYRAYDKATYSNNCLTDKITCVEYDAGTGEIRKYFYAVTDDKGDPQMLQTWGADELSPDVEDKLHATIFAVATTWMAVELGETLIDSLTSTPEEIAASNKRVLDETNRLREQDEKMYAEMAERDRQQQEDWERGCADFYEAHCNDPDYLDSWEAKRDYAVGSAYLPW